MSKQSEGIRTRHARSKSLHIGILMFPGVEVPDFAGPLEVFSVASRAATAHQMEYDLAPSACSF